MLLFFTKLQYESKLTGKLAMSAQKWRHVGQSEKPIFDRIVSSLRDDVFRPIGNALDEIRGHVTRPMIVEWVEKHAPNTSAIKCAAVRNKNDETVTLFLIDEIDQFVYDVQGNRLTATFKCTSLSSDVEELFSGGDSIILEI